MTYRLYIQVLLSQECFVHKLDNRWRQTLVYQKRSAGGVR